MSLVSNKEDSDRLSKLQEQNGEEYEDAAEEVDDSGKRKGKQTKESIQRKQKKRKVEETYPLSSFTFGVAFHHQSLKALIVSLEKACPSPSLI